MGEYTLESNITPALTLLMGVGLAARSAQQPPEPVTPTYARLGPIDPLYSMISNIIQLKIYHAMAIARPGRVREASV
jgi:hypothetical protein